MAGSPRAWITLDLDDDHPERFWLHVGSALRRTVPEHFVGKDLFPPVHRPGQRGSPAADLIMNAASADGSLLIVLDQLDRIRNPSILGEIEFLVEQLPTGMQLILTSRVDPQLPIARWRARSWLLELRQGDLAFTTEETTALFVTAGEDRLSNEDIGRLASHTEGWVAALRLALISMKNSDDPVAIAQTFSGRNRMIADLLASEVLDRQPEAVQQFLLQTSVLRHLDADLCNELTGRTDSEEMLRALEANICFVVADDERTSYRYHQLFAELLRLELERRHSGMSQTLRRKAAEHLEARGDLTEAIGHCLAVGETDRAFDLAFASAVRQWDHDDVSAAAAWVDVFPSEYVSDSVQRMLLYALAVSVCGRLDEATAWLDRAEHQLRLDPGASERDLRHADALRVLQLGTSGAPEDGIDCGRRAVDAIASGLDLGTVGDRVRVNLARAHLLVDDWTAAADAIDGDDLGDSVATLLIAPAVRARVALRRGHLHEALEEVGRSLNAAVALGVPRHFGTVDALIARTGVLTERNELAEAVATIAEMHTRMERHRDTPAYDVLTRIPQVRVAAAAGGLDDAFAVLEEARASLGDRKIPLLRRIIDEVEARWRIESGELRSAEDLVDGLPHSWPQRSLLAARLALVRDRPRETIQRLGAEQFATLRDQLAAQILVARACLQLASDDAPAAFTRAAELAAREGFVRMFIEEGAEAVRHFRIAADGLGTPAGTRLASALGAPPRLRVTTPTPTVLSERESAVLRFLPSGLTNKEIASECFMSVNTVKTHLKGIYSKLGASTRSEAVDRARRWQLL
jgi:LuxR family maltose regulon positive regulatory protein